jgi:hypothetical protein
LLYFAKNAYFYSLAKIQNLMNIIMRRFYLFTVMFLLSVGVFAQMLPDNWTIGSSAIAVTQESIIVSDGLYAMSAEWTSTSNQDIDSDPFTVSEGASYSLEVDAHDNDPAGRVRIAIIWNNGTNDYFGYSSDDPDWQLLTQTGTVPAGATEAFVRLRFYDVSGDWDGDANVIIDNVVYTEDGGANLVANFSFEDWSEPSYPEYTIYEIQGQLDASPYLGDVVQTTGVVTGTFSTGYFIQDGAGAWNGIYVFDNTNTPAVGDEITIIGEVGEYFNKTQLASISSFTVNSSENILPAPVSLSTIDVNDEMYEGVLVAVSAAICTTEPDGNNEWIANDGSGDILINDLMYDVTPELYGIYNITGIVDYAYGDYKIEPRNDTDIEYLGSELTNALTDAANNTAMTITPETQTIDEGVDAIMNANVVYPATIDALLADYYMDAVIDFGAALPNDVDVTVTYSQNGSTPNELGTFTITETTTEAYLSEIIGAPRTLLSAHAGLELDWGITVTGLVAGTYNITIETVTNTDTEFGTNDFVLANDDAEIIVEASVQDALTDAANNTVMTITPETQTIDEGVDAIMNANVVYPATVDALLADYYMDAVIDFGAALPNDVDVTVTYSQNGSTPNELGTFTITETTTEAYLSEIIGAPRTLLSAHAGLELDWGITVAGLVEGTYNINMQTVTNTEIDFGTNDYILAADDAEIIVEESISDDIVIVDQPMNTVICEGDSVQFIIDANATEALSYEWYYNEEIIEDEEDNFIYAKLEGDYYCVIYNDLDTVITEVFNLSISIPVVELGEDATYCSNFVVVIDAGDFDTFMWNTGAETQTIETDTSGTYMVEVTDIYGCIAEGEITLTFDDEWELDLPNSINLCEGDSFEYTLPDADSWVWSTGENTQSVIIDEPGMIYVTVTQGSCVEEDSIDIISVVNPPEIDLGPDKYLCTGDTIEIASPTYSSQYRWHFNNDSLIGTGNSIEVTIEGLYSLTVLNGAGCSQYDEINVYYNDFLIVNIGDSVYSCDGQEIKLSPGEVDSLVWDNGTEVDSLIVNTTGWYYVTVVDDLGCEGTDSAYVFFHELPEVNLGNDTAFCAGNILEISAPDAEMYAWNTEDSTQTIEVSEGGSYTVTITDINGCQNYDSKVLTVWDNPFIDLGPDKVITEDQTIVLGAEPGHPSYVWSTGETSEFIVVNGLEFGIGEHLISVTVISENDCENYDEVLITVIEGVGISTNITDAIKLYPNPANKIVNIELDTIDDFVGIEVINIEGKIIYENNQYTDVLELNIENWQEGLYFVRIVTENEIGILKFVKN